MEREFLFADEATVRETLIRLSEQDYKIFARKLNPGVDNILGLRIPVLRSMAKDISKRDWRLFMDTVRHDYLEERLLVGFLLGYIKPLDFREYMNYVDIYVSRLSSWTECDTFVFGGGRKFINTYKNDIWNWLMSYVGSEAEYEVRFAIVMIKKYFLTPENLQTVFDILLRVNHQGYYVRMAVAWTLSEAMALFPVETLERFADMQLDRFTYNKAIQKCCESYRISTLDKKKLRSLRR